MVDLHHNTKKLFTISDLSREFDVTTRSIRFYEDEGLLSPERVGRNRYYSPKERVRLMLLLRGKRLGFSLSDIKELFDIYDAPGEEPNALAHSIRLLQSRRTLLEQQRKDIDAVLKEINSFERQCKKTLTAMGGLELLNSNNSA
ncbi:MerR family DNA-binding transcriptional regulator [Leeia sp. TBRC 13508]|uniref:MerR family DNA-binding transcriptional regulator n=1 Tax=Leeia speluncae TaxID=2884804 RepID=A0ABS8D8T7_9NEIS|nr:MerR family DNA-binding transcriptional regulator [Leeia speluncae]MCB6184605.1 MerR family DNA-binding transcriptional regulator [Leeia speluncae]